MIFFYLILALAGYLLYRLVAHWVSEPTEKKKTSVHALSGVGKKSKNKRTIKCGNGGGNAPKKKVNPARTKSGKVPQGRTLTTKDKHLNKEANNPDKDRPVVVIEADENNNLAVVQLSSRAGKDRTRLKNYQQGKSRYKHYVEIEDTEGNPIRVNEKFRENHPNMDVSAEDVKKIRDKVLNHSSPMQQNQEKIKKFRTKKG